MPVINASVVGDYAGSYLSCAFRSIAGSRRRQEGQNDREGWTRGRQSQPWQSNTCDGRNFSFAIWMTSGLLVAEIDDGSNDGQRLISDAPNTQPVNFDKTRERLGRAHNKPFRVSLDRRAIIRHESRKPQSGIAGRLNELPSQI